MLNFKWFCFYMCSLLFIANSVLAAATLKTSGSKIPSFVKLCQRSNPNLNICARNALNLLKDHLHDGIPELDIPPMEPLIIPEIKMNQDTGTVYMKSTYKNVHIYGLSDFDIKSLNIEPSRMKFTTNVLFKNITINADYEIDGKVMMMPLKGSGTCTANFTDVDLTTVVLSERQKKDDRNYLKIKDIKVNYEVGKVKLNLNNLFNGDKTMGDRMNKFLNSNWDALSDELKPLLEKSLNEVVQTSANKLFETFSYDDILPL